MRPSRRWLLLGVAGVALALHLWGIRRDLPYITDDMTWVVHPALGIAATGDPNPHQFAYPGSTLVYPLAAAYHCWNAAAHDGSWVHAGPQVRSAFDASPSGFLLISRLLTVGYAVLSVPVIDAVGRAAFDADTALIGTLLAVLQPGELFDKRVTTNSASMFFCMLGLWCCLRLLEGPSIRNQVITGGVIGLAIGTKYPLATLVATLLIADAMILWQLRARLQQRTAAALQAMVGLAAVPAGFLLCTPYFLLDFATVMQDVGLQFGKPHFGADGLSPFGNLSWYVAAALPSSLNWPQRIAALVGIALVVWRRRFPQILLLSFAAIFLCGISVSSLHWVRWLIPVLPVFALFAAHGLETFVVYVSGHVGAPRLAQSAALVGLVALMAVGPLRQIVQTNQLRVNPSTYVLARQWVEANLPPGARVAYEWETLPPPRTHGLVGLGTFLNREDGHDLFEFAISRLSKVKTLEYYSMNRYHYLVASKLMYGNYLADPRRYPVEAAFYSALLTKGRLLHQVDPSPAHEGEEIRIYEIP
ncbi:MAG TPA: glycosyltransferase family 39 protein [Candidatus Acidoferrales bacterium]|nr:glycosyltransferase family 39 protein [Candidatus Acidoferrales bacterium]